MRILVSIRSTGLNILRSGAHCESERSCADDAGLISPPHLVKDAIVFIKTREHVIDDVSFA